MDLGASAGTHAGKEEGCQRAQSNDHNDDDDYCCNGALHIRPSCLRQLCCFSRQASMHLPQSHMEMLIFT